ncbi:MAG: hypothetical protein IT198_13180 [Acidimicrobiia bacterium]|nr:hypothetical protein [Acidimicrobiia bacterium]
MSVHSDGSSTLKSPQSTALCSHHHRLVHETGHQIEGDADHTLTFKRPDSKTIDVRPPPPV